MSTFAARASAGLVLGLAALVLMARAANGTVEVIPAAQTDVLTIIAEDSSSPWSYPDGTGYANDVVEAAFAAAGVRVRLVVQPYARCKQSVLNGSTAGCFSMSWEPELEGRVVLSEAPLFVCHCDYMHRVDRPLEATSEQTIRTKIVVGSVRGYEYPPSVARLRDGGFVVLEEAGSEMLNLRKLDAGRIDAALLNHNEIKTYQSMCLRAGVRHDLQPAFRSGELMSHIGFSTRHPRGQWARERFNEGFGTISKNGVALALTEKWKGIVQRQRPR